MAVSKKNFVKKNAPGNKKNGSTWKTIHVFGYGESQVVGDNIRGKVANSLLKNISPFLTHLNTKLSKNKELKLVDLHALTIMNSSSIVFHSNSDKIQSSLFAWQDVDSKLIDRLAKEIISKSTQQAATKISDLRPKVLQLKNTPAVSVKKKKTVPLKTQKSKA